MGSASTCLTVIISGYVQGVGFRYFVQRQAQQAGLTGWIRNLANGNVEIEVAGDPSVIDPWLQQIKTGHPWARVDTLHAEPHTCTGSHQGFLIR